MVTGRAEFAALEGVDVARFRQGLQEAERGIDTVLNLASSRLGLDHDRVFGGVGAIPVMSRYLADREFRLANSLEGDRLLYWYVHSLLWGRYAGSTETVLNTDLQLVAPELRGRNSRSEVTEGEPLDLLIGELRRHRGDLRVHPDDFRGWSRGARFYPLLYMLSRVHGARDLRSGLELREHLLGRHAALEVHHLFPKALLSRQNYGRPERNALANFAFLTLDTNRSLGNRSPSEYLPECEQRAPGSLASQWIPEDPELWHVERYPDFLAARRELLARAANALLGGLLGTVTEPERETGILDREPVPAPEPADEEERAIEGLRSWLGERGLNRGIDSLALLGLDAQSEEAVLDVAWPEGLAHGDERVALLLNEPVEVLEVAGRHGYRFFTSIEALKEYADEHVAASAL